MISERVLVIKIPEVMKSNWNFKENKEQEWFFKRKKERQKYQIFRKIYWPSNWEELGVMEQLEKWNEDFMEPLMEAQKEDAKRGKGAENFYFKSGAYWEPS